MRSMHEGRLITFCVVAAVVAVGAGLLTYGVGAPIWLGSVVTVAAIVVLTLVARRVQTRRWGFDRRHWVGELGGRPVEVVFDERLVFLNRVTLLVDGRPVDHKTIWYGTKELSGDGVTVVVGSGWIGECTGAEVRDGEGASFALTERD